MGGGCDEDLVWKQQMAGSAARRRREFRKYRAMLLRWGWFVLLCGVIAGGSAYVVSKKQPRIYRATAQLFVDQHTIGGDIYSEQQASEQLVQIYLGLITSPAVLQRAADKVGGISAGDLWWHVRVEGSGSSTPIIYVHVDDRDPVHAAHLANAVATSFIVVQQQTGAQEYDAASQQLDQQVGAVTDQITTLTNQFNALQNARPNDPRLVTMRSQLDALGQRRGS